MPRLTYQSVKLNITHNESATVKGHMNQTWQRMQSTKCVMSNMQPVQDYTYFATTDTTSIIHIDQTGKFPIKSSHGFKYVMICYAYSCNAILTNPFKHRSANKLFQANQHLYTILHNAGLSSHMHKLDNKTSADIEHFIATQNAAVQFVPLDNHHTNAAERAIQTWKNHFIARLTSLPKLFPITYWCQLIEQANITLNLMRPDQADPTISAYKAFHGTFHFQSTPMAPLGTKCLVHIKPNRRQSW